MRKSTLEVFTQIVRFWKKKRMAPKQIARYFGINVEIVYRARKWLRSTGDQSLGR